MMMMSFYIGEENELCEPGGCFEISRDDECVFVPLVSEEEDRLVPKDFLST